MLQTRRSLLLLAATLILASSPAAAQAPVTIFEGARVITGDGNVIENGSIMVEGSRFVAVGRRADVFVPTGAVRIDLAGKTVMPTMTDLHGHLGFQNVAAGTMSKETFTRENLIDHLQRLAYHGVGAVVGIGDLVDRMKPGGGRTGWGDVPLRVRDEVIPGAALFKTAGAGMAYPGAGAQGHASRADVMYEVTTPEEVRAAVEDHARMKPEFIKIWVDDRNGTRQRLTPPLYRAIVEEAKKANIPVAAHNVTLADAKELMRLGVEGWLHPPVRGGEEPDDEFLAMVRDRKARNDRPNMWFNDSGGVAVGGPEAWNDPLLRETISAAQIQEHYGEFLKNLTPEAVDRARQNARQSGVIAKKLSKVPFDQLSARLMNAMASLDQTLKSADHLLQNVDGNLAPQVQSTLAEAQAALKNAKELLGQDAPLENDLGSTLLQVSRAAKSISALVDYLERHPESLLRGKPAGAQ